MKKYAAFIFFICGFLIAWAWPNFSYAAESEKITNFSSQIEVLSNGKISVKESISYYFPAAKHGIYRYIPYVYADEDNKQFYTEISSITVKMDSNKVDFSSEKSENALNIKIGDKNKTITGNHIYEIDYTVDGVINNFSDHDELYWNVTGDDWSVPIEKIAATVKLPEGVETTKISTSCYTGAVGKSEKNCLMQDGNPVTYTTSSNRLTIVAGWPTGLIEKTTRNYSSVSGTLGVGKSKAAKFFLFIVPLIIPLLALAFMIALFRKKGRDIGAIKTIAPEFSPPKDLPPAEIGAILDENVQMRDLTAEIIKFAVDGYIKINEIKGSWFSGKDYELVRVKALPANAKNYQHKIFNILFDDGQSCKISDLKKERNGYREWQEVKNKIYEDVNKEGFFAGNPNTTRNKYYIIAGLLAFAGLLSIAVGFWGSALTVSALIVGVGARFMPQKTQEGSALLAKIKGFKMFISKAEKYRAQWAEKENLFFDFLPYAILFGETKKWANAFKDVDLAQPDWYSGNWATFNAVYFASNIDSFSAGMSAASTDASTGHSGLGGGGFSGGGFGGGGGGSW